jgi:hypothetical protein
MIVRIEGMDELRRKLSPAIVARPARSFLMRGGRVVQKHARENAPRDRGGLRRSIEVELDSAATPLWARIGTNSDYGRATELGRPAGSMPPSAPLELWARRHPKAGGYEPGDGKALAIAIFRRGIEARPFLEPAMRQSEPAITGLITVMAREIEAAAAKG